MKQTISLICILTFIVSCAAKPSPARYEDELSAWLGQSEENLYAEWGYPNTTYSAGPNSFIATYLTRYNEPIDGDTEPYANNLSYEAMSVPSYGLPTAQGIYYCKTSFVIKNGIVTDFNFNGDDCVR